MSLDRLELRTTNLQPAIEANRILISPANLRMSAERKTLDYAGDLFLKHFGGRRDVLVFPHAAGNREASFGIAEEALKRFGAISVIRTDLLTPAQLTERSQDAQGFMINGGNTWVGAYEFNKNLYLGRDEEDIADVVRKLAALGIPGGGWSAGPMLEGYLVGPCDDDKIRRKTVIGRILPKIAANLLRENLNVYPHYEVVNTPNVESWMKRNPGIDLIALENGSGFYVVGPRMEMFGEANGVIFRQGQRPQTVQPSDDISGLLKRAA